MSRRHKFCQTSLTRKTWATGLLILCLKPLNRSLVTTKTKRSWCGLRHQPLSRVIWFFVGCASKHYINKNKLSTCSCKYFTFSLPFNISVRCCLPCSTKAVCTPLWYWLKIKLRSLIEIVRSYSCLFDTACKEYKDITVKTNVKVEISNQFEDRTVDDVSVQWNHLVNKFRRIRKIMVNEDLLELALMALHNIQDGIFVWKIDISWQTHQAKSLIIVVLTKITILNFFVKCLIYEIHECQSWKH